MSRDWIDWRNTDYSNKSQNTELMSWDLLPVQTGSDNSFSGQFTDNFLDTDSNFKGFDISGYDSVINNFNIKEKFIPTLADKIRGYRNPDTGYSFGGYGMPALQLAEGAMKTWLGLKQLGIAEDTLDFRKNAFSKQFATQQRLTNNELRNRAKAAYDRNPNNNLSPDEYMDKYGV